MLKDVAPAVTHVTVMFNPRTSPYNALRMQAIERAAPGFQVSVSQLLYKAMRTFATQSRGLGRNLEAALSFRQILSHMNARP